MMSPFTRVYFGYPPDEVPRDTRVGYVAIRYGQTIRDNFSLRYSNNAMDVLSLPIPGEEGPDKYDGQVLLFSRKVERGAIAFHVRLGTTRDAAHWRRLSNRIGGLVTMTSGRRWGVF